MHEDHPGNIQHENSFQSDFLLETFQTYCQKEEKRMQVKKNGFNYKEETVYKMLSNIIMQIRRVNM